ncbi:hypothetical protein GPECTOR_47g304 [Gonium pectorale]|uniref:Ubiquitin-like domain-containing protein n=1 Tax=Gonium pectorale TaxID=33097 RepID=A0A150G850_GONPE|nr:hypothetical protein GPECTOR_47g304 [Gonium pectorale]|eukprot:KXZ46029.1 hypothetical protein GPECTOR_47g304 [Gonium pectorale]
MRAALRSSRPLARGACGAATTAVDTIGTTRRIAPPLRHGAPLPSAALSPSAAATAVCAVSSGQTPSAPRLRRRRTVPAAAAFEQDAGAAAGALRRRLVAALSCGPSGGVLYPEAGREGSAPDLPSAVVTVKLVSGGEMTIAAKPGDLVDDVMLRIEQRTGVPPDQQRLVLAGRVLRGGPGVTMAGAGVRPGDKLQMVQRLQGGC